MKSGKCKNRYSEARSFLDGLPVLDPVSYTHLDVYKRQGKEYVNVLDFIGNYEKAGRAPFLLNGDACIGERTAYDYSEIEYPDDCIVDFDMRLIDLFREMDKKLLSVKERIQQEYYRVKELLDGKVPTRMELFTNMDDNIYEYCMKHSKENPFKQYMDCLLYTSRCV